MVTRQNLKLFFKKDNVLHPFLFAVWPTLGMFSFNISLFNFSDILLPLALIIAFFFLFWLLLSKIFSNGIKAGLITSIFLILFFTYGIFHYYVTDSSNNDDPIIFGLLYVIFIGILISLSVLIIKTKKNLSDLTFILNCTAATIILISFISIGNYYFDYYSFYDQTFDHSESNVQNIELPNVYYIILDEYANSKSLKKLFDFGNKEFLTNLKDRGFFIPSKGYNNYPSSFPSIPSMLNLNYVNHLDGTLTSSNYNAIFHKLENQNLLMQKMNLYGYSIINIDGGINKKFSIAEKNLCINEFFNPQLVHSLTRISMLKSLDIGITIDETRKNRLCVFSDMSTINEQIKGPIFVYAHLILPHSPFLFGPNGEYVNPENILLEWETTSEQINSEQNLYLDQLKFTNKKTLELVDKILISDPDALIIIQSDHGLRLGVDWENPSEEMMVQSLSGFQAYYFPTKNYDVLYDDMTPVNSWRIILNSFFEENYDLLDDSQYWMESVERPWNYTDVSQLVATN